MYEYFMFYVHHLIASVRSMHLPSPQSKFGETHLRLCPEGYTSEVDCLIQNTFGSRSEAPGIVSLACLTWDFHP